MAKTKSDDYTLLPFNYVRNGGFEAIFQVEITRLWRTLERRLDSLYNLELQNSGSFSQTNFNYHLNAWFRYETETR